MDDKDFDETRLRDRIILLLEQKHKIYDVLRYLKMDYGSEYVSKNMRFIQEQIRYVIDKNRDFYLRILKNKIYRILRNTDITKYSFTDLIDFLSKTFNKDFVNLIHKDIRKIVYEFYSKDEIDVVTKISKYMSDIYPQTHRSNILRHIREILGDDVYTSHLTDIKHLEEKWNTIFDNDYEKKIQEMIKNGDSYEKISVSIFSKNPSMNDFYGKIVISTLIDYYSLKMDGSTDLVEDEEKEDINEESLLKYSSPKDLKDIVSDYHIDAEKEDAKILENDKKSVPKKEILSKYKEKYISKISFVDSNESLNVLLKSIITEDVREMCKNRLFNVFRSFFDNSEYNRQKVYTPEPYEDFVTSEFIKYNCIKNKDLYLSQIDRNKLIEITKQIYNTETSPKNISRLFFSQFRKEKLWDNDIMNLNIFEQLEGFLQNLSINTSPSTENKVEFDVSFTDLVNILKENIKKEDRSLATERLLRYGFDNKTAETILEITKPKTSKLGELDKYILDALLRDDDTSFTDIYDITEMIKQGMKNYVDYYIPTPVNMYKQLEFYLVKRLCLSYDFSQDDIKNFALEQQHYLQNLYARYFVNNVDEKTENNEFTNNHIMDEIDKYEKKIYNTTKNVEEYCVKILTPLVFIDKNFLGKYSSYFHSLLKNKKISISSLDELTYFDYTPELFVNNMRNRKKFSLAVSTIENFITYAVYDTLLDISKFPVEIKRPYVPKYLYISIHKFCKIQGVGDTDVVLCQDKGVFTCHKIRKVVRDIFGGNFINPITKTRFPTKFIKLIKERYSSF